MVWTSREIMLSLQDVSYKDWKFIIKELPNDIRDWPTGWYLQVEFFADGEIQRGRKWLLSKHMTKSEIVSTALKAVLTAEEHEAREAFRYKGKRIFGPHFDVDVLEEIAGKKVNLDLREPVNT